MHTESSIFMNGPGSMDHFQLICSLEDQLIESSGFGTRRDNASLRLARDLVGLWDRYMNEDSESMLISRDFYAAPHVYALGSWFEDETFASLWQYLNNKISTPLNPEQMRKVGVFRQTYRIIKRD